MADKSESIAEREEWKKEIEHDRHTFEDPTVKRQFGEMMVNIVANRAKQRPLEDIFNEWDGWVYDGATTRDSKALA